MVDHINRRRTPTSARLRLLLKEPVNHFFVCFHFFCYGKYLAPISIVIFICGVIYLFRYLRLNVYLCMWINIFSCDKVPKKHNSTGTCRCTTLNRFHFIHFSALVTKTLPFYSENWLALDAKHKKKNGKWIYFVRFNAKTPKW